MPFQGPRHHAGRQSHAIHINQRLPVSGYFPSLPNQNAPRCSFETFASKNAHSCNIVVQNQSRSLALVDHLTSVKSLEKTVYSSAIVSGTGVKPNKWTPWTNTALLGSIAKDVCAQLVDAALEPSR